MPEVGGNSDAETLLAKAEKSSKLDELRDLEALSYAYGLVPEGTPRWRGRKPVSHSGGDHGEQ